MLNHGDNKKIELTKILAIISPIALIFGGIFAYGALDTTVKTDTRRIDKIEQAVLEIKQEFSGTKNEMIKTQGQVAQIQQKVDLIEKNLVKEIDSVKQRVESSTKELRADLKEQNQQVMALLIDLESKKKK